MRAAFTARLFTAVFLLIAVPVAAQSQGPTPTVAQGSGVVEGQVLNGTLGNVPVVGLSVSLWALDAQQQSILQQGVTNADGRFRFQGLDTQAHSYQVQATYGGIDHWSAVLAFSPGQDLLAAPMAVYESTTSAAGISVARMHLIVELSQGTLVVQEMQIVGNEGTQTYVGAGGQGQVLQFPLPEGAAQVELPEELVACCIVGTADGFAYTRPVFPGSQEFFFSYELAYTSSRYTLAKNLSYPVSHLDVLVGDQRVAVTGPGLVVEEPVVLQDRTYQHLTAENLSADQALALHFANLPLASRPSEASRTVSPLLVRAVIGLGTLGIILALAYPFFKKRTSEGS